MSDTTDRDDYAEEIDELNDPNNYEFMETPHGTQIHIVGTGLPESMLVRGGRISGAYSDEADKALCGTVSEFEPAEDVPTDVNGVIDGVCSRCNSHAWRVRGRGKFSEVPL